MSAIADALSDALLQDEADAKDAMEGLFADLLDDVAALAGKPDKLTELARAAVLATQDPFMALVRTACERALDATGRELDVCELTMAKRHAGVTDEAVVACRPFTDQMILYAGEAYRTAAQTVLPWFDGQLRSELATAKTGKEPADVVLTRLLAPKPVALPNHSGRGLWWKVLEHCNRITREAEIAAVNAVRQHTMGLFNEKATARD